MAQSLPEAKTSVIASTGCFACFGEAMESVRTESAEFLGSSRDVTEAMSAEIMDEKLLPKGFFYRFNVENMDDTESLPLNLKVSPIEVVEEGCDPTDGYLSRLLFCEDKIVAYLRRDDFTWPLPDYAEIDCSVASADKYRAPVHSTLMQKFRNFEGDQFFWDVIVPTATGPKLISFIIPVNLDEFSVTICQSEVKVSQVQDQVIPMDIDAPELAPNVDAAEAMATASKIEAPPTVVHISQQAIADELFKKSLACLGLSSEEKVKERFDCMEFLIMVPRFNTLKEQTRERIMQFADLVPQKEDAVICMLYPSNGRDSSLLKTRIKANSKTLYVLVVDECHYGPTTIGISLLHDEDLRDCSNFLKLLVSATPFNCMSNQSSIEDRNIVEWGEVLKDANHSTTYVGFEYYARSMAFRLLTSFSLFLTVENGDRQHLGQEKPVDINFGDREFATFSSFCEAVNEVLTPSMTQLASNQKIRLTLNFNEISSKFTFSLSCSKPVKPVTVRLVSQSFLHALGFTGKEVALTSTDSIVTKEAESDTTIDECSPIRTQHIRCDLAFHKIKGAVENNKKLKQYKNFAKKSTALGSNETSEEIDDPDAVYENLAVVPTVADELKYLTIPEDKRNQWREKPLMKPRNGFILVMDYIFSLVYFSLRIDAYSTMGGEIDATKKNNVAAMFVKRLQNCCYCIPVDLNMLCNLLSLADFMLSLMLNAKADELGCPLTDTNWRELLGTVIFNKREQELNDHDSTESQTWFTETDRIVKQLLMDRPAKSFSSNEVPPGMRDSPAPMVMMRVFDNDENLSMQAVLRHARDYLCNVRHDRDYLCDDAILYPCLEKSWRFSIIGDISKTRLFVSLEDEFKHTAVDSKGTTLSDIAKRQNDELKYEDLSQLPCLVILCEKGRMGDTFPQSLRYVDLRLRTAQAGSALVQELGRMCRYASSDPDTSTTVSIRDDGGLCEGTADMTGNLFRTRFPFGVQIFDSFSNAYVGVAENVHQLLLVLRTKNVNQARVCRLRFPLPTALIYREVAEKIQKAVDAREKEIVANSRESQRPLEVCRNDKPILHFVKFGVLDDYMSKSKHLSVKDKDQFKLLKNKKPPHYDLTNGDCIKDARRLLLFAECQIGKTGAFLAFLDKLGHALLPEDPLPAPLPSIPEFDRVDWCVPYWKEIAEQSVWDYAGPNDGKYIAKLAAQRYKAMIKILRVEEDPRLSRLYFQKQILSLEYPASNVGLDKLMGLNRITPSLDSLHTYVNWDGRVSHDVMTRLPTPESVTDEQLDSFRDDVNVYFWGQNAGGVSFPQPILSLQAKSRGSCVYDLSGTYVLSMNLPQAIGRGVSRMHVPSDLLKVHQSKQLRDLAGAGEVLEFCKKFHDMFRERSSGGIRYWTFSPSYIGKHGIKSKKLDRRAMFPGLNLWVHYVQVLVVRAEQFDIYREYYGADYIILSLPDELYYSDSRKDALEIRQTMMHGELRFTPENSGPGYARLFIQRFAELVRLGAVWMIDDNVSSTYRIDRTAEPPIEQVPFLPVMQHIEAIFDCDEAFLENLTGQGEQWVSEHNRDTLATLFEPFRGHDVKMFRGESASNLCDMIGEPKRQYGALGISRCLNQRQPTPIKHPIKCTYSVYSFYLFNVKATCDRKLYYPPRKTMEDIEMNFMMEEAGLVVCKLQMYCHVKPVRLNKAVDMRDLLAVLQDNMPSPKYAVRQLALYSSVPGGPLVEISQHLCAHLRRNNVLVEAIADCGGLVCFVHGLELKPGMHIATAVACLADFCRFTSIADDSHEAATNFSNLWYDSNTDVVLVFPGSVFRPHVEEFALSSLNRVDNLSLDIVLLFKRKTLPLEAESANAMVLGSPYSGPTISPFPQRLSLSPTGMGRLKVSHPSSINSNVGNTSPMEVAQISEVFMSTPVVQGQKRRAESFPKRGSSKKIRSALTPLPSVTLSSESISEGNLNFTASPVKNFKLMFRGAISFSYSSIAAWNISPEADTTGMQQTTAG
eukprot:gene24155-29217_t